MTEEQTQKLREVLRKVPTMLLKQEIGRRYTERKRKAGKALTCQTCQPLPKRMPDCQACYELKKIDCRNRARLKRGIPLDAPINYRNKAKP